ncbi:MAG: formate dehydrogenase subunit gamma [Gemmatimonadota bacterium]
MKPLSGDDVHRFTFAERVVHWVAAVTFVLLLLSGLALSYPSLYWLTAILGGGEATRILHPWIGAAFTVSLVAMTVIWMRDMGLSRRDLDWLGSVKHYALHETERVPPAGKYNAGQKIFFWAMVVLGVLLLASGVVLWFPDAFPRWLRSTSRMVHYVAALGGGLFLVVHIYLGTIALPGTARGMLFGRVSRAWAKHHHLLWYRDEVER